MLGRIIFIACFSMLATGLYPQNKATQVVINKQLADSTGIDRAEVVEFAKKFLGTTYKHGGIDPLTGFDCSGFVYFVFKKFSIQLPRGSAEYRNLGKALKPEEFKVGDVLVFYGYKNSSQIGHVGIICKANGLKSKFIHSSSGKNFGVTISELGSEHYTRRFYKCIDVIR